MTPTFDPTTGVIMAITCQQKGAAQHNPQTSDKKPPHEHSRSCKLIPQPMSMHARQDVHHKLKAPKLNHYRPDVGFLLRNGIFKGKIH